MPDDEKRLGVPATGVTISNDAALTASPKDVASWLISTGETIFVPYFGSRLRAEEKLAESFGRSDSVFWRGRCRLLLHEEHGPIGGYFLLSGEELRLARSADAMVNFRSLDKEGRPRFNAFLAAIRNLTAPVPDKARFLSGIGVLEPFRGRGFGRFMLEDCIRNARLSGATSLHLDVESDNNAAVHLYETAGFREISAAAVPEYNLGLRSLRLDFTPGVVGASPS